MMEIAADIIGLAGVVLIVLAYFLIQSGRVSNMQLRYPLLNLIGAALILCSLLVHWNLPSFVIELIWIAISVYGILKIMRQTS